jgi:hypothetical protein
MDKMGCFSRKIDFNNCSITKKDDVYTVTYTSSETYYIDDSFRTASLSCSASSSFKELSNAYKSFIKAKKKALCLSHKAIKKIAYKGVRPLEPLEAFYESKKTRFSELYKDMSVSATQTSNSSKQIADNLATEKAMQLLGEQEKLRIFIETQANIKNIDSISQTLDATNNKVYNNNTDIAYNTNIIQKVTETQNVINDNVSNNTTSIALLIDKVSNNENTLLNKQDKISNITDAEFAYLGGVTRGIQGQIDLNEVNIEKLKSISATRTYVDTQLNKTFSDIMNATPEQLNTLKEFADALNNDASFAHTISNKFLTIMKTLY